MEFTGSNFLRLRLALSMISGKAITIKNIRKKRKNRKLGRSDDKVIDEKEGLREYEAKLLRLIDKLCDDTTIRINEDGDELYFKPGFLIGNVSDEIRISDLHNTFHCGKERSITYFIEFLLMIIPFFKYPVKLLLKGITDDSIDSTVYTCKTVSENFFKNVLKLDDNFLNITILKRGIKSDCSGEVLFFMNNLKTIEPFDINEAGLVKKITGTIVSHQISVVFRNKLMNIAKKNLHNFTPHVNIQVENSNIKNSNLKNHFISLSLFAHTKNKCIYATDMCIDEFYFKHAKDSLTFIKLDNISNGLPKADVAHIGGELGTWEESMEKNQNGDENDGDDDDEEDDDDDDENDGDDDEDDDDEEEEGDDNDDESDDVSNKPRTKQQRNMIPKSDTNSSARKKCIIQKCEYNNTLHDADIYERLGFFISLKMINEIKGLPSVDTKYQWLPLLYMALGNDIAVSKISLRIIKPYSVALIRLLRDFFSVVFDVKKVEKSPIDYSYLIKCVGIGYRNISKKTF
ncbi:RNA 3'-terminal phosphate cyclase-like protein [Plasmodium gonderi]|uniref:RNA 3'-terminal phosphate cyclase-like protein n=1 Tax=Plasmodium gonderi TaxID=77519 RepID=A0A1Y1JLQ6_PLAGO|nr:RNA 3'-terminal phosphate cyclase-like protein [Plasmodium gonderi]GAW82375.1 RNA 3'-terminal phosphate cyclase-like protein [Plasmodium gonderi]